MEVHSGKAAIMKVWVYPERTYEELGAVRFQLSWEEVRLEARGKDEIDYDEDIIFRFQNFKTKAPALRKARHLVDGHKTAFGAAWVTRQVVDWYVEEDHIAVCVDTSEAECVH